MQILRRVFSFPVALASLLTALAVLTVQSRFDDPDLWWHLKTGQIIWKTHHIPVTDLFSYTTNHHAWVPQEWLSQAIIYGAYRLDGLSGLMLWLCFITSAVLIAGYALCARYSGNAKVGFAGALIVWLFATSGFSIRPQMIGYFLLLVELLLIHLGRTSDVRWFWGLPALFALWVNCHGSFLLGLIVAGVFLLSSFFYFKIGSLIAARWEPGDRRIFMWAVVLSVAALLVNPDGVKQLMYPVITMLHQPIILANVDEWKQPSLGEARGLALIGTLLCCFLLPILRRSDIYLHELLLLILGAWLGANHQRLLFVFGILAAPVASRMLSAEWEGYDAGQDRPLPNIVLIALSLSVAVWAFPARAELVRQVEVGSPVKAVEFVKSHHLSGPMLNDFDFGGYLIWAAPEYPVFVDGRADVFEWTGVLGEFGNWATLQSDPHVLLDKYRIGFCLLMRRSDMARVLPLLPDWKIVYSDDQAVVVQHIAAGQ